MATCADLIVRELQTLGTQHFFLVTGGDHALFKALSTAGVRQVLARSEHAAVYMADAYARASHQPTFVYGQYGPGAANIAGSLAEPWWARSPVVAMTSTMRRPHRHRLEYQELDQPPLFASVTKWQAEATIPEQVPSLVRAGARIATAGQPGPVYVGVPNDLTGVDMPDDLPVWGWNGKGRGPMRFPLHRPRPHDEDVVAAARLLADAQRPVVLAGNGVHASEAYDGLDRLLTTMGIPLFTSLSGKGAAAETSDLAFGTAGRYSRNYVNDKLQQADTVLVLGSSLGGLVTDSYRLIDDAAKVVQVDIDPAVLGHNCDIELGIQADVGTFLEMLATPLETEVDLTANRSARESWVHQLTHDRASWYKTLESMTTSTSEKMRPESVLQRLALQLPGNGVLLADTGYAAAWAGALVEIKQAGRGFMRADGSLGWAFPAAIGAHLADPDRLVVSVTGDGGIGYHLSELETAARLGTPLVWIVLNNQSLAFEYHIQEMLYGKPVVEVDDYNDADYAGIARECGVTSFRVHTTEELDAALRTAMTGQGPVLIDAIIDKQAIAPVTRYDKIRTREL